METNSFFLRANAYFKELRRIRRIREDAGKPCPYPVSWQELCRGRLSDTDAWGTYFQAAGAKTCQGLLILLPLKASVQLCVPTWIDGGGAFIHGGDYRTLPWVTGPETEDGVRRRAEAFLEAQTDALLETREWTQFFRLCSALFEYMDLGTDWKEHIVCLGLSGEQEDSREQFYDTVLQENSSNRLYRSIFYRLESLGTADSEQCENELRGQMQLCGQGEEREFLLGEYIQYIKEVKRPPVMAVAGRDREYTLSRILPFWEEVTREDTRSPGVSYPLGEEDLEEEKAAWYVRLRRAESKNAQMKEKMDTLMGAMRGSIRKTKEELQREILQSEERIGELETELRERNRQIDRTVGRKNEWIVFLDSVSGGRYKLSLWKNSLARRVEDFCDEQDAAVLEDCRDTDRIVELYDEYIKELLTELRKRNDKCSGYKEKNIQDKRQAEILETGLASIRKMAEAALGKEEADSVDWEALETASEPMLREAFSDLRGKLQIRTAWIAHQYCRCCRGEDGSGEAPGEENSLILCDIGELSESFRLGKQERDSLDLLVILNADDIAAEDGIPMGNFASRMALFQGDRRWKGGVADGVKRLLLHRLELDDQQEVYCRADTLWDVANKLLPANY